MAGPIDVIQRALSALASAGLGSESPAEAYVLGYQAGWREALDLCIRIETAINTKRRKRMSIISSEIEAQKQRDPSYIDSGLAVGVGTRIQGRSVTRNHRGGDCRRHGRNPKVHRASWRMAGKHHQNRLQRGEEKGDGE